MFDRLMNFLNRQDSHAGQSEDLRASVAVLLLEAAHRSDHFGPDDRALIERLLAERFGLSKEQCAQLVAASEAKVEQLVQLQPYTHTIFTHMTTEERIQVIEMLWEVVYADGVLDPEDVRDHHEQIEDPSNGVPATSMADDFRALRHALR